MNEAPSYLPPHGRPPESGDRMACRWCSTPTLVSMLNHYGARCLRCYEAYLREPRPCIDGGDKRYDPVGWAKALKAREDAGDKLTPAQRTMYRAALGRGVAA